MLEKRTLREWMAYFDSVDREYSQNEFLAVMVFNQREYCRLMVDMLRELKTSAEYTEAMLGALDVLAEQIAGLNGLPYASSHAIRAAMDAARDEQRQLAAAARADGR